MESSEDEAIRRVLTGDCDAYRILMEAHFQAVYRVTFRITGNPSDAEEAAQEAFLRGYNKLASFERRSSFATWMTRIAMNTAFNLVERRRHDLTHSAAPISTDRSVSGEALEIADHQAGPERLLLNAEVAGLRRAAMLSLTPMERTAFTMRHMEDLPLTDIAQALDIPVNSVKQAVFRAVFKLRRTLAPLAGGLR